MNISRFSEPTLLETIVPAKLRKALEALGAYGAALLVIYPVFLFSAGAIAAVKLSAGA